jgi:hypothetical protein
VALQMLHPHTSLLLDQIMAKFFDTIRGDDDKEAVALACTHSQKSSRTLLCSIFCKLLFASFLCPWQAHILTSPLCSKFHTRVLTVPNFVFVGEAISQTLPLVGGFCMQKNLAQIVELLRLLFDQKTPCQVIYIFNIKLSGEVYLN